ncbi:MAG: hypothetical protein AAB267_03290 [Candidatus Desantisbacteria bacterium]
MKVNYRAVKEEKSRDNTPIKVAKARLPKDLERDNNQLKKKSRLCRWRFGKYDQPIYLLSVFA